MRNGLGALLKRSEKGLRIVCPIQEEEYHIKPTDYRPFLENNSKTRGMDSHDGYLCPSCEVVHKLTTATTVC